MAASPALRAVALLRRAGKSATGGEQYLDLSHLDCPTGLVYPRDTTTFGQIRWQLGADVQTPYIER